MPNWCSSSLIVTGDINKLVEFDKKFKAEHYVYTEYSESDDSMISYDKTIHEICLVDGLTLLKSKVESYSFENFISIPEEEVNNWYEWRTRSWGTKWDVCNFVSDLSGLKDELEPYVSYSFDTAWSPCEKVVLAMAKEFPDLHFEFIYDEEGMCYAGLNKYLGGVCIEKNEASDDDYRKFKHEYFEHEYYKCKDCNELIEIYEYEEDEECPVCYSTNILDTDHETLLEQEM